MLCNRYLIHFALGAALVASAVTASAQAEHPQTWAQDIAFIEKLTPAEAAAQQGTILQIREDVERWINNHPESKLEIAPLSALPKLPMDAGQTATQVKELAQAIAEIVRLDPAHPFHLGAVDVNVTATVSEVSPLSDNIDQTEMAKRNEVNAAQAMEDLPGVSVTHTYSGRNQEMISIHGFGYLQVPLYVDGILMNDPYDGTLDDRQIPTADIAEIQVAKGFSSALMGPNAVGGAINIVTKEPQKKFEGELLQGGYSGNGLLSSARLGSRMEHYFIEGSMDWLQDDYIPLSGNFVSNAAQTNDQLNHSNSQNAQYNGRAGWTPNSKSEYVFTYMNEKARGGIPVDAGDNPLNGTGCGAILTSANLSTCYMNMGGKAAFRSWSYWDKTSYYFHSDTGLGDKNSLKTRVFYDEYPNYMLFYTDDTFSTLMSSFITTYDDHSDGFSAEFDTKSIRRNAIGASIFFKDDTHKETPMLPEPAGDPQYGLDRQQMVSIGLQDVISIAENLTGTVGMSFDHIDGLRAADSNNNYFAFVSPQCQSNPNTPAGDINFTACTPHQWAYNPQASLAYSFKDSGRLFAGFAQKSRFPVLKEMYSYKMGKGIPNPGLKTEHSQNWEIGYSRAFARNTTAQLELFRSDLKDAIESIAAPQDLINEYPTPVGGAPVCSSPSSCSIEENASSETHQGAELTLHSAPLQKVSFDANYTYVNKSIAGFSFAGQNISGYPCGSGDYLVTGTGSNAVQTTITDNTCLTPTDLPKNKAVGTATLHLPLQAMLDSTLRYEGGNKAVDSYSVGSGKAAVYYIEAVPMSHFATLDVGGTMPIYKGATLQAGVKNLLDRNYYQTLDIPEAGRNWFVNMRYRF